MDKQQIADCALRLLRERDSLKTIEIFYELKLGADGFCIEDLEKILKEDHRFLPPPEKEGQWEISLSGVDWHDVNRSLSSLMGDLPVLWDKDLSKIKTIEKRWHITGLIPEKAVTVLGGKRASCKTWTGLNLAVSLASGKPLFGSIETKKSWVLYIDEETGIETLAERLASIKKGFGITESLENLGFMSFEGFRIDEEDRRQELEEFLSYHKQCVVIVDSFRRIISCEENDAGEMSRLFTDVIRPMIEKYDSSFLLIHHLRKGLEKSGGDPMDELRGSSELANYADVILLFRRVPKTQNKFILSQAKCRRALEQQPLTIQMNWSEDKSSVTFENLGSAQDILDSIDRCCVEIMTWTEENNTSQFKTEEVQKSMQGREFSRTTVTRSLTVLEGQNKIKRFKRGLYQVSTNTLNDFVAEASKDQKAPEPIEPNTEVQKLGSEGSTLYTPNQLSQKETEDRIVSLFEKELSQDSDGLSIEDISYSIELNKTIAEPIITKLLEERKVFEVHPGRFKLVR